MACGIEEEELDNVSHLTTSFEFGEHTLETTKVLTSITTLLATTEASATMFRPLWTLRMI